MAQRSNQFDRDLQWLLNLGRFQGGADGFSCRTNHTKLSAQQLTNRNGQIKLALIRDLFVKTPRTTKTSSVTVAATPADSAIPTAPVAPTVSASVATKPAVVAIAPTVAVKTPVIDISAEVLKATRDWAAAWSAQKSDKYLAFYAKDFITPDGMSRSAWEDQRKERITKPKSIKVEVQDAKVKEHDSQHASVSFKQSYRASHLKTSSSKVLVWVKNDGHWQITEERSPK